MFISPAFAADAGHAVPFYAAPEFWVGIAFVIVVVGAFRPVSKAITAGLDKRSAQIKARLDEAAKLRDDSQAMLAEYQRKQRDAMKEAEDIIAHARGEAERLAKQAAADLEASLKRREQQAIDRIAQAEAQAMKEVRDQSVDIAVAAARKLLAENLSAQQSDALITKGIADLSGKLH
jgi:F-type H+-transporting ATPase subunit b